jgi:hypothetical protein
MEESRSVGRGLMGRAERKNNLQCLGIDRKIILKFTMKISDGRTWTGFSWLRIGKSAGCPERTEEHLDLIKFRDYLTSLGTISFSRRILINFIIIIIIIIIVMFNLAWCVIY